MKFDYTHGNGVKWMVSMYGELVIDQYYFDNYRKAKETFDSLKSKLNKGTVLSLYDVRNDIRKEYVRG